MEALDYWRLSDELELWQAALLMVGELPEDHHPGNSVQPKGYPAAIHALRVALRRGDLTGHRVSDESTDFSDWSVVEVASLKSWLRTRGFATGFFFPDSTSHMPFLNREDARYSMKLEAAVRAWMAVTDPRGKSPKQAVMRWLREHAADFGLVDDEGKPMDGDKGPIAQIASVVNWQGKGGAPATPASLKAGASPAEPSPKEDESFQDLPF